MFCCIESLGKVWTSGCWVLFLRSLLALKVAVIMPIVPTGKAMTAKPLIKQYLLNRAWCQLHNLPVGLQKKYTFIALDFFSQQSSLALQCVSGSCVSGCCSCSAPAFRTAAFPADAAVLAWEQVFPSPAVWLCLLQQPSSVSVGSACAVLCRLEYSACPAVGMGAVSCGAGPWWDNAPCRCWESASCWSSQAARAPGGYCSCQSHRRAEPWPCTRVTRFSSLQRRALSVFDKEK